MAVPKKKTSKSRRDKRRATHKIEAPRGSFANHRVAAGDIFGQPGRLIEACFQTRNRPIVGPF